MHVPEDMCRSAVAERIDVYELLDLPGVDVSYVPEDMCCPLRRRELKRGVSLRVSLRAGRAVGQRSVVDRRQLADLRHQIGVLGDVVIALVEDGQGAEAGDDAAEVCWVRVAALSAFEGLVPGLLDFLRDRGIVAR